MLIIIAAVIGYAGGGVAGAVLSGLAVGVAQFILTGDR